MTAASTAGLVLALAATLTSRPPALLADSPAAAATLRDRIGVFLRCTGKEDPEQALRAVRALGLDTGVRADAVVVVFAGESYKDRDSVMRSVGLRPTELRQVPQEPLS